MSHKDYIAECDETQLDSLITMAQARLAEIRASGWAKLWVVSVGWANVAWFAEPDYQAAVEHACNEVKSSSGKASRGIEMEVKLEKYRPEEVEELLAVAKAKKPVVRA